MRILLLTLVFLVLLPAHAEIYRSVDENGNIIYSDKPSPDAEQVQVDEIQTIKGDKVPEFEYTPPKKDTEKVSPYKKVAIDSPQNKQTISNNAGNINVDLTIDPGLLPGHQVVLFLDGEQAAQGGKEIQMTNVARGTHTLIAAIQSGDGKDLIRSAPVVFTLHRHSIQHQPSTVGKPPPNNP